MSEFNQIFNTKYTKAIEIASRISARFKSKKVDINDIIEWCAQCEIQEIRSAPEWFLYKDVNIEVKNYQALVPCNLYRLLDVMGDNNMTRIKYYYDGTYIRLDNNYGYASIYINYYGLPIDDQWRPLIIKGHEKAVEYFCIKMLFEEDFIQGKMNATQWQYILSEYEMGLAKAYHSKKNLSRNEIAEMTQIQFNMIQKIGNVPRYNLD